MDDGKSKVFRVLADKFIGEYYPEYSGNRKLIWDSILDQPSGAIGQSIFEKDDFKVTGLGFSGKTPPGGNLKPVMFGVALFALASQDNRQAVKALHIPPVLRKKLYKVISEHFGSGDEGYSESIDAMALFKMIEDGIRKISGDVKDCKNEILDEIKDSSTTESANVRIKLLPSSSAVENKTSINLYDKFIKSALAMKPMTDGTYKLPCMIYFFEKEQHVILILRRNTYTIKDINKKDVIFKVFLELSREHRKANSPTGYVSGEVLEKLIWGQRVLPDNYLSKYISALSRELSEANSAFSEMIESEKRWGYRLRTHPRNIFINPKFI